MFEFCHIFYWYTNCISITNRNRNSPVSTTTRATFCLIFFSSADQLLLWAKCLQDLTSARTLKVFVICIIRIFTIKIDKSQLRGNNSVCAGALQLMRGRAPAQLRRNIGLEYCLNDRGTGLRLTARTRKFPLLQRVHGGAETQAAS
jgi:hypothetical protein